MKMLVTGATGFVGSWLVKKLLDHGHEVRILSRETPDHLANKNQKIEVVHGDLSDVGILASAMQDVHSVFHLAGLIGYTKSLREQMYQTNVVGTQNIITAFQKAGCERLVYMSSVVAVGASFDGKSPLNENSPYNIAHLDLGYFETKHEAEQIVLNACRKQNLNAVIINPSTIYGAGDAKKSSRNTQLKVARGKFPFYTEGGVNVIHIDDVIEAVYSAWKVGRSGERYILAGENILIKDLFGLIAQAAQVRPPAIYLPTPIVFALGRVGDLLERIGLKGPLNSETAWTSTLYHWFDNSKAKKDLGLTTRPAKVAIYESVHWMKDNGML